MHSIVEAERHMLPSWAEYLRGPGYLIFPAPCFGNAALGIWSERGVLRVVERNRKGEVESRERCGRRDAGIPINFGISFSTSRPADKTLQSRNRTVKPRTPSESVDEILGSARARPSGLVSEGIESCLMRGALSHKRNVVVLMKSSRIQGNQNYCEANAQPDLKGSMEMYVREWAILKISCMMEERGGNGISSVAMYWHVCYCYMDGSDAQDLSLICQCMQVVYHSTAGAIYELIICNSY
ncbi:uncharacterized protein MYCFIDRAFT_206990 [Pseudocercospora fijiensis CIRAD86]|uniref:Uncharacterized protein n=1 Tax=Pseudocercospora fijiensis (strain CIRAD86) TaxID=383855 RepID=M3BCK5_PSEFD|nr:uncharacterized protein MYCFIDRAFT_206990 [Pseudocercospora fijiensis CIRAD86]EME86898.1 hypothetical protein MYCFIDRAFT_206990 [Pseudocercospora fijiensis CIRAD86]